MGNIGEFSGVLSEVCGEEGRRGGRSCIMLTIIIVVIILP